MIQFLVILIFVGVIVLFMFYLLLDCRWRRRIKEARAFIETMTGVVEHPISEQSIELTPRRRPFVS